VPASGTLAPPSGAPDDAVDPEGVDPALELPEVLAPEPDPLEPPLVGVPLDVPVDGVTSEPLDVPVVSWAPLAAPLAPLPPELDPLDPAPSPPPEHPTNANRAPETRTGADSQVKKDNFGMEWIVRARVQKAPLLQNNRTFRTRSHRRPVGVCSLRTFVK
jgi:hypothetical protein